MKLFVMGKDSRTVRNYMKEYHPDLLHWEFCNRLDQVRGLSSFKLLLLPSAAECPQFDDIINEFKILTLRG